ncbi:MAG: hypothetical protein KDD58_00810 [Bdellovibrionales bacterium]|nr:hypothetical protein [Bdellovibrionales bacterium]
MKIIIALYICLVSCSSWAYSKKNHCNPTELQLKNCPLDTQGYRFHFLDDKILIHDGVWRNLEKFPLQGKETEWQNIYIKKIGRSVFVEILVWTAPYGEAQVQNLKWYVYKIDHSRLHILAENIVQRRNKNFNSGEPPYFFDNMTPHALKDKKGKAYLFYKGKEKKL